MKKLFKILFLITFLNNLYIYESSASINTQDAQVLTKQNVIINDDVYSVTSNNCKVYNSAPKQNETVSWSGACESGFAIGTGELIWYENGKITEINYGNTIHGKFNGHTKINMKGIHRYNGNMVNGKEDGFGVLVWITGSSYSGNWKYGKRSGYGKLTLVPSDNLTINDWKSHNIGHYEGANYIVEGIFSHNDVMIECKKENCPEEYFEK